jgi:RNA polymerase sigma-70 factor (ECF subfamily)
METTRCADSTDDELLVAVANGDMSAFAELYDRFAPQVFGRARTRAADTLAAEDVTREVFLEFWRQAPTLHRRPGSVADWLLDTGREHPSAAASNGF